MAPTTTLASLGVQINSLTVVLQGFIASTETHFQDVDKRFQDINKRFDTVDKHLDTVDKRLDIVDKRLDTVDKRLDTVNERLDTIDKRLDTVDKRLHGDAVQLANTAAKLANGQVSAPWDEIELVYGVNSEGLAIEPENYPLRVRTFWRLRDLHIISLLRFYGVTTVLDIRGYASDTSEREEKFLTLEEALRANRLNPLSVLAAKLGLDFGAIRIKMDYLERKRKENEMVAAAQKKRAAFFEEVTRTDNPKHKRIRPVTPEQVRGIDLDYLLDDQRSPPLSEASSRARAVVTWDSGSPQQGRTLNFQDEMPIRPSRSPEQIQTISSTKKQSPEPWEAAATVRLSEVLSKTGAERGPEKGSEKSLKPASSGSSPESSSEAEESDN